MILYIIGGVVDLNCQDLQNNYNVLEETTAGMTVFCLLYHYYNIIFPVILFETINFFERMYYGNL